MGDKSEFWDIAPILCSVISLEWDEMARTAPTLLVFQSLAAPTFHFLPISLFDDLLNTAFAP